MPDPTDQGTPQTELEILLPGDMPQAPQDTSTSAPGVSPATGDQDDMSAAFEAAGLKPPDPKPAPATPLDPQLLETLLKLDPASLPKEVLAKFDLHLQPDYTRKTQALAEDRRIFEAQRNQMFERMEGLLTRLGTPKEQPADRNQLSDLRERIRNGDVDAVDAFEKLVDDKVQQQIGPMKSSMAIKEAYDIAEAREPLLKQHAEEVGAIIRQNPDVVSMLTIENHKFAPMVFAQIARDIAFEKLKADASTWEARTREAVEKGIRADRARVASLPPTTTHAGTTAGVIPVGKTPGTFEEARAKTLADLKGMGIA